MVITTGTEYPRSDTSTEFVIATNQTVNITRGGGASSGDIFTVLPLQNGFLQIETFNNTNDKLNLTAFNTIHSMSDLVITSGSVIITFPITGQKIRIVNLTPADMSESNFMFHAAPWVRNKRSAIRTAIIVMLSYISGISILVYLIYLAKNEWVSHKERAKIYKEGIIANEKNQTLVTLPVAHKRDTLLLLSDLTQNINAALYWDTRGDPSGNFSNEVSVANSEHSSVTDIPQLSNNSLLNNPKSMTQIQAENLINKSESSFAPSEYTLSEEENKSEVSDRSSSSSGHHSQNSKMTVLSDDIESNISEMDSDSVVASLPPQQHHETIKPMLVSVVVLNNHRQLSSDSSDSNNDEISINSNISDLSY